MEVAAYREPSVLDWKSAFGVREAFDAKREVSIFSATGNKADTERAMKLLRQRFQSELVAVRGLCEKARKIKASPPPRPAVIKRRKIKAASHPPPAIKRSKIEASPPPPPAIKHRKVTHLEAELLKADLEKLELSQLPHHMRGLVEKHTHAVRDGYLEFTLQDDDMLELRKQLDGILRHQERNNMMTREEDEDVDIVGGVSPLAIASAPLPLAEEEEDEYVDICGDASPAKNLGVDETISGTPCSSSSSNSCDSSQAERDATLLMASAKESLARCTAREKARQDVLRTERAPKHMTTETIHPELLQSLGIFEYDYHRGIPYTVLPQLGLFLKDDDDQEADLEEGKIPDDLEEGEIRF